MTRSLDVAGTIITVPDPDEITGLSGRFQAMGNALADAQDQLSALASPQAWSQWTGQAADAFGQTIGQLPGQLGVAQESYHAVAAALSDYADQLRPVVATLSSMAARADEAAGSLNAAQTARDQVYRQPPDPSLAGWDARVTAARAVVEEIQAQVWAQQSEMKTLATRCVTRINQALPGGGKKRSLLGSLGHDLMNDVVHPLSRAASAVAGEADVLIVKPFQDLATNADQFWHDPSWANLSKTLADLTAVIGVVSFLVPGLGEVLAPVMLPVVVAALAADAGAVARGETSPGEGFLDAVDVGLAGGGTFLGAAVDGEQGMMRQAWDSGELEKLSGLADGTDARVSVGGLLKGAITHPYTLDNFTTGMKEAGQQVTHPLEFLNDYRNTLQHWGVDGNTHSPAGITLQQVKLPVDVASHVTDAVKAQVDGGHHGPSTPPSSEGQPR